MNFTCSLRVRRFWRAFLTATALLGSSLFLHAEELTADGLFQKAVAERRAGNKDAALDDLNKAVKLSPARMDILFEFGTLASELSGPRRSISLAFEARDSLEKVIATEPGNLAAREWLIGFYSGAPFFAGGSMSKAHKHADALFAQQPWQGFYWKHRLLVEDKDYDEAFKLCETMLAKDPSSVFVRLQLGVTSVKSGKRLEESRAALESSLSAPAKPNQPGPDQICLQLGLIAEKLGDKTKAIAVFQQGLQFNKDNQELAGNLKRLQ